MITRAQVMPYVGQRVVVRTADGMYHHGILHSATGDGIYLRRMGGRPVLARHDGDGDPVLLQDQSQSAEMTEAFWPFFFFPFFALAAFWPWAWWW